MLKLILGDSMEVLLGVSRRHVHMTKETWDILFGNEEIQKRNDLGQPGQYASMHKVDVAVGDNVIEGVRVIGPFRSYNQIELAETDANFLGIKPPRRQSGELDGSLPIKLIGPEGSIELSSGAILAEMHIHMTTEMANNLGYVDKQVMAVYKNDKYLFDAKLKISDPAALELHIDTDEAEYYNLSTGEILDFRVCGK